MMKLVLLLCTFIALAACGCNTACSTPPVWTNFTRLNLEEVRKEIRYYFPSSPIAPPSQFITNGVNSAIPSLQFREAASLSVTFMFEGAGNRNQLGYYTYDLDGQGRVTNKQENLLFRDIESDPPCVKTGMTVTSPPIPAGKRFGFFLISDGYCGGTQKYYLDSSLNTPNDVNVRHVGLYVDAFRELMIIGFEDLLRSGWDNDFEDTMFIFDSNGVDVQFDGVPFACTNPPCSNGGTCNYNTGSCDCSNTKYTGRSCQTCSCSDNIDCTPDICNGASCLGATYQADISQCLGRQSCSHGPCVTTGIPTTGIPTTGVATTRAATTGAMTTGVAGGNPTVPFTTGKVVTTGVITTGIPTTGYVFTTGAVATTKMTTGLATTGEILEPTKIRPNYTVTFTEAGTNVPTVSSDEIEGGAVVIGFSLICSLAVFLF